MNLQTTTYSTFTKPLTKIAEYQRLISALIQRAKNEGISVHLYDTTYSLVTKVSYANMYLAVHLMMTGNVDKLAFGYLVRRGGLSIHVGMRSKAATLFTLSHELGHYFIDPDCEWPYAQPAVTLLAEKKAWIWGWNALKNDLSARDRVRYRKMANECYKSYCTVFSKPYKGDILNDPEATA